MRSCAIAIAAGSAVSAVGAWGLLAPLDIRYNPPLSLLVVLGAVVVATALNIAALRHQTRQAADVYSNAFDLGYDLGYKDGRKVARPVVVPLDAYRVRREDVAAAN